MTATTPTPAPQAAPTPTVVIEVRGGVAEVTSKPAGITVVIVDHDDRDAEFPVTCSECDWSGDKNDLDVFDGRDHSNGTRSRPTSVPEPAGLCPDCGQPAYPESVVGFGATLFGPRPTR